ncbi:MAG: HlyC/CorC family transporter [Desulfovibrio sp.]|nr:MAG: HlyC/CorC family transporter [Desulfovibrio sp.]
MTLLIISTVLAIVISASCSVAEAVLYSIPWSYIEQLRKQRRPSGFILYKLRADVEKPITAVLTLNTVANTAGASIAGAAAADVFGSAALGVFAAFFTLAILLFSEILPKTLGVAYARSLAPVLAKPLLFLVWVFTPMIWVAGSVARKLRPTQKGPRTTEDDIRAVVSLTRKSGFIKPFEESTIKNILALDEKMVKDIMTPRTVVFSLPAETRTAEARTMKEIWRYSRIPVYENNDTEDIVGVVFRRNVLNAVAEDQDDMPIGELMRPVRFVVETLTLDRLLVRLLDSRQHLSVVLDEYGGVAGVVTLEDVLEEILGKEIVDESDAVEDLRELARQQRKELTKSE